MMSWIALQTYRALRALDRPIKREHRRPHGVAMLIALVTIALLSVAVVEFTYTSRVNLAMAANSRDRLKSYYLARSAVNLTQLLLSFQFALQNESMGSQDQMGQLIGRAMQRSNFQMYQYVNLLMQPFNSGRVETPVGGIDLSDSGVEGFGDFTGEFDAQVTPEAGRISLNMLSKPEVTEEDLIQLCAILSDPRYNELFELQDEYGDTLTRGRVIGSIVDFMDLNQEGIIINDDCTVQGSGGDEGRSYERAQGPRGARVKPRDARLTHVEDLRMIHGVTDTFMDLFGESFTVYDVGKPNINVANAAVFYAILCQAVELPNSGGADLRGLNLCARDPSVASQVMFFALALDGIRAFFENPLTVLLAYVGSTESQLLPSAKKGQPVAFLSISQFPAYVEDLRRNPALVGQFVQYSPMYMQLVMANPQMAINPLAPNLPPWTIQFRRTDLVRQVSTTTPELYRVQAQGRYGSTQTTIEVVMDLGKTVRRMPDEQQLEAQETDPEALRALRDAMRLQRAQMPRGRILYWRER